jgi:hypothetical protein
MGWGGRKEVREWGMSDVGGRRGVMGIRDDNRSRIGGGVRDGG